jgi:hypothetical protein
MTYVRYDFLHGHINSALRSLQWQDACRKKRSLKIRRWICVRSLSQKKKRSLKFRRENGLPLTCRLRPLLNCQTGRFAFMSHTTNIRPFFAFYRQSNLERKLRPHRLPWTCTNSAPSQGPPVVARRPNDSPQCPLQLTGAKYMDTDTHLEIRDSKTEFPSKSLGSAAVGRRIDIVVIVTES